jgi:membrane-bound inhibitor of C-type lysozyme
MRAAMPIHQEKCMKKTAAALCLLLAGCGSWNPWAGPTEERTTLPADTVTFRCDGDRRLLVRMPPNAKSVTVMLPERQFRLDQEPSGAGTRFSNGRTTLQTRGDEAFLEEDGKQLYSGCKQVPR